MVLALSPEQLGPSGDDGRSIWGVVMDTGLADHGWHCLVALADGTSSLYTSAAFGIIGAGAHETVRRAADALLASTETHLDLFGDDADDSTPPEGTVAIRALTFSGRKSVSAPESELGYGRHPAAEVFHAAHAVITEMRQIVE